MVHSCPPSIRSKVAAHAGLVSAPAFASSTISSRQSIDPNYSIIYTHAQTHRKGHLVMLSKLFGGKKKEEGAPFAGDEGQLWFIEGKAYDLAKFLKAHPGT